MKQYINKETQVIVNAIQFTDKSKNSVRHYSNPKRGSLTEKGEPFLEVYTDDNWSYQTLHLTDWFVKVEGNLYGFVLSNEEFNNKHEAA